MWVADGSGQARVFKSPTTLDVMTGVLNTTRLAAEGYGLCFEEFCARIVRFGHGTTVGLNALLTRRAARCGVLTTEGFGDTLEIGRMRRLTSGLSELEVTDFFLHNRYDPIVPRDMVEEVPERIDVNGRVVRQLDETQARAAIARLVAKGAQALAICTLWSPVNPVHELRLHELALEAMPDAFITLSHEVSPGVGEYGRMSTAAANAALGPVAGRYLSRLEKELQAAGMTVPVLMMTNAGGVLPTASLTDRPAYAIFSGPAAGVIGSLAIGEMLGEKNLLATDIGGTSFDVGVIVRGRPVMRQEISVAGADIRVPSIDVDSIGAGGGSIASVQFGALQVGPQSAGSMPGPACYGRGGTEPTATDADLVLGVLDPNNFIGGAMKLDGEAARRAIHDRIAKPLGVDVMEAAWGIREVLDAKMAALLRRATIERGHDPRDFVFLANGGAGPSHAWALTRELGLPKFIVPAAATAQSAFGCANSSLGLTRESPVYLRAGGRAVPPDSQLQTVEAELARLSQEAAKNLESAGARGDLVLERVLSIRYRGQTNTLDIVVPGEAFGADAFLSAARQFEQEYEGLFGRGAAYSAAGFEVVGARVTATGHLPPPRIAASGEAMRPAGTRSILFDLRAGPVEAAIWRTSFPPPGAEVVGPAVIEFPGQSVVVPPGGVARADEMGNLHVSIAA
ncbi:hydantoinase/oxoprolinase family protein [Roseomonas sp. KE2513]|nr:hydantoinase/oxoprolinase family protein [Roseomonas sp. KE2513]